MSVLSTHLWGKRRTVTPLSAVGERVARMRLARDIESGRFFMAVFLMWPVWWGGATGLASHVFGSSALTPAGGSRPLIVRITDALASVTPGAYAIMAGFLVFALWGAPRLWRWQFERQPRLRSVEACTAQRRSRRIMPKVWLCIGSTYLALGILAAVWTKWPVGLLMGSKFLSMFGAYFLAIAFVGRHGTRLVCAKCGYLMGSWRGALPLCPECGRDWRKPWGAMIGSRRLDRRRLWAGVGLLVLAAACAAAGIWGLLRM